MQTKKYNIHIHEIESNYTGDDIYTVDYPVAFTVEVEDIEDLHDAVLNYIQDTAEVDTPDDPELEVYDAEYDYEEVEAIQEAFEDDEEDDYYGPNEFDFEDEDEDEDENSLDNYYPHGSEHDEYSVVEELKDILEIIIKKSNGKVDFSGKYFYYNGNDGTDFGWDANGRTCKIRVENDKHDFEFYITQYGHVGGYAWIHDEQDIVLEVRKLNIKVSEEKAWDIAHGLYHAFDALDRYDEHIITVSNTNLVLGDLEESTKITESTNKDELEEIFSHVTDIASGWITDDYIQLEPNHFYDEAQIIDMYHEIDKLLTDKYPDYVVTQPLTYEDEHGWTFEADTFVVAHKDSNYYIQEAAEKSSELDKLLSFNNGWVVGISAATGDEDDNLKNQYLLNKLVKLGLDFIGPNNSVWEGYVEQGFLVHAVTEQDLLELYALGNLYNQQWVAVWEAPLILGSSIIEVEATENHTELDGMPYSIIAEDVSGYVKE